jgi:hypothetical protein
VPCKIIGTSNPYGDRADWSAANTISKDELPLIRPVLDRFPLIRNFNKETDPDKAEEFAREKARRRKLKDGNYQFVVKAVLTMRQLNPSKNIEFSREVDEIIIPQLYRRMITSEKLDASPRVLDNIYKICKAWAKVNLTNKVTSEMILGGIQKYITDLMIQYSISLKQVLDPKEETYLAVENYIRSLGGKEITIIDAVKRVQDLNKRIESYVGKNYNLDGNRRLRSVVDCVLERPNIIVSRKRPITVYYSHNDPTVDRQQQQQHHQSSSSSSSSSVA